MPTTVDKNKTLAMGSIKKRRIKKIILRLSSNKNVVNGKQASNKRANTNKTLAISIKKRRIILRLSRNKNNGKQASNLHING